MKKLRPYIKPRTEIIQVETEGIYCIIISNLNPNYRDELDKGDMFDITEGDPDPEDTWDPLDPTEEGSATVIKPSPKSLWED